MNNISWSGTKRSLDAIHRLQEEVDKLRKRNNRPTRKETDAFLDSTFGFCTGGDGLCEEDKCVCNE